MADGRITVFGGSGFLGRRIVRRLAADGARVRVAVRRPERAAFLTEAPAAGRVVAVRADVWDEASVAPAVAGADAVVNLVGHYAGRGGAAPGRGAAHVARAAATAGARRLVHISGLGADPASGSPYARARGVGEVLVREAFPGATVLRPGVLFGPGGGFLDRLAALARALPVLPLFGRGATRLQPVYVGDVAEAVAKALALPEAKGELYELGGPRVYTYEELVRLVVERSGRRRLLLPVPFLAWEALAALTAPLPTRPVSRDQVALMQRDNVVSAGALTLADLGVAPTPLEAILPTCPDRGDGH